MQLSPKEEAQSLVDALLPIAEKFLLKQEGEFYPFGAKIDTSGKIIHIAASDGTEHPLSDPLIKTMHEMLSVEARAGRIRCSAVVFDARVVPPGETQKTDAVVIELEHKSGYNVTIAVPYKLHVGQVEFGEIYAIAGEHHVFPSGS